MTNKREDALRQMLKEAQARPGVASAIKVYGMAQRSSSAAYRVVGVSSPVLRTSANLSGNA